MKAGRALRFFGPYDVRLDEQPAPGALDADNVLIRVRATGICGTDLNVVSGNYPVALPGVVLGHESAGEVLQVGAHVTDLAPGDRVCLNPTFHCGRCRFCRTGRSNHCVYKGSTETGITSDGTFATFSVAHQNFVHHIPDDLAFHHACLAEPLGCALTGVSFLRLRPHLRCQVFGAGPMGLLYAHALALTGLRGRLVEKNSLRANRALSAAPSGWTVEGTTREGAFDDWDIIVDTTGHLLEDAVGCAARGGQVLLVGLAQATAKLAPDQIADRSLSVVGSIDTLDSLDSAVALLASGAVPAERIVTDVLPLEEYDAAFKLLGLDLRARVRLPTSESLKVVLRP